MNQMLKKLFAGAAALCLAASMCVPAFAAESLVTSVTLKNTYTLAGNTTDGKNPDTTFTYSIEKTSVANQGHDVTLDNVPVPTFKNGTNTLNFAAGTITAAGVQKDLTIDLPTYTRVGIYTYTIRQTVDSLAGVAADTTPVTLKVTVTNHTPANESDTQLFDYTVAMRKEGSDTKLDSATFSNTYSGATLSVKNVVTGLYGDKNRKFDYTVTFTKEDGVDVPDNMIEKFVAGVKEDSFALAWSNNTASTTFQLSDSETATFKNLPYGVSYKVEQTSVDGYTTTISNQEMTSGATGFEKSIESVVTNTMTDTNVDTGIVTDNAPYLLLLAALVAAGMIYLVIKRKNRTDEES